MGTVANVKVEPCNVTWDGDDLGFIDGDLEITTEEQSVDITAHQEGTQLLDSIRTGNTVSIALVLKESAVANIQRLLNAGGEAATPAAEVTTVTCVADVAGSLNNKYFLINTALDAIQYYVWFNVNNAGADPTLSGKTGVEVDLATAASASTAATAVQTAIDALPGFTAAVSGAIVTVTNVAVGGTTDAEDVDSGVTIAVSTQGVSAVSGWGTSKRFESQLTDAKKLVLHPVKNAASNLAEDLAFWKAYPMLESITRSGENPTLFSVPFKIFKDSSRADAVNMFVYGEHR